MTDAATIVGDAYREINVVPIGATLTPVELAEGLSRLNRICASLFGFGLGEVLADWLVPSAQNTAPVVPSDLAIVRASLAVYPPVNVRLVTAATVATRIYFYQAPVDGARMAIIRNDTAAITLDGNGKTIEGDFTVVLDSAGADPRTSIQWLYRADLNDWVPLVLLTSVDDMPLPDDFDDYFVAALAIRLAPMHGRRAGPEVIAARGDGLARIKARYFQRPPGVADNSSDLNDISGAECDLWTP